LQDKLERRLPERVASWRAGTKTDKLLLVKTRFPKIQKLRRYGTQTSNSANDF